MAFDFKPEGAKEWSKRIIELISGEGESFSTCSRKFNEQIEKLVRPGVWAGEAAYENYNNFMTVHNGMIDFLNSFGMEFQDTMMEVGKGIEELEVSNLGVNTDLASVFGTLSFNELVEYSEKNVNKADITYDYDTILEISTDLNRIVETLKSIEMSLRNEINKLNSKSGVWDGEAAERFRQALSDIFEDSMKIIKENLDICVSNIAKAAEKAQELDLGM